mmetsp:Transcript_33740/g.81707  ORF Transcript_33740/g.81707 Transcript_33740/m.81707 type:complete len:239 (+) Transcript_33740:548-1264(+)
MVTTVLKSTPMVEMWKSLYTSDTNRVRRHDFPTPESPTVTSLNLKSPSPDLVPSLISNTLEKKSFLDTLRVPLSEGLSFLIRSPPKTTSLSWRMADAWAWLLSDESDSGRCHREFLMSSTYRSATSPPDGESPPNRKARHVRWVGPMRSRENMLRFTGQVPWICGLLQAQVVQSRLYNSPGPSEDPSPPNSSISLDVDTKIHRCPARGPGDSPVDAGDDQLPLATSSTCRSDRTFEAW